MSKSKRVRKAILTARISIEELKKHGSIIPEDYKNTQDNRKQYCLEYYRNLLYPLHDNLTSLTNLILSTNKILNDDNYVEVLNNEIFIIRSVVIQYFVVLDSSINQLLYHRQTDQGKNSSEIQNYSEVDKGIKEHIMLEERTAEFEKLYSKINHFRTLRNQFAHYPYGMFILTANKESFESFLEKIDGIETDAERGYHCYIDCKQGFLLPYSISSNEFVNNLLKTGTDYFKVLLDIFLPQSSFSFEQKQ